MIPTTENPILDPVADLTACQHAIRASGWWQLAARPEAWPLSTHEAAVMLYARGYDVDAADLDDLIARRLVPRPGVGENGFEWLATDLCHSAGILDARRQWLPAPNEFHDCKKHPSELMLEAARAAGELGLAVDSAGPRFDVRHLLALLVECPSHEGRRKVATLLQLVLEHEHDLPI